MGREGATKLVLGDFTQSGVPSGQINPYLKIKAQIHNSVFTNQSPGQEKSTAGSWASEVASDLS